MKCGDNQTELSICMIQLILVDLKENYDTIGGGITRIDAGAGMSYTVALPQEERTDLLTYKFEHAQGAVSIKSKTVSVESY